MTSRRPAQGGRVNSSVKEDHTRHLRPSIVGFTVERDTQLSTGTIGFFSFLCWVDLIRARSWHSAAGLFVCRVADERKMFRLEQFSLLGVLLPCLVLLLAVREAGATILLFGNNGTLVFQSMDASFTPAIPEAGVAGTVFSPDPLSGCSPLPKAPIEETVFAVVQRGGCAFENKVRIAQDAGYAAAIVFDDVPNKNLVTMSGNGDGITAYALFVSKEAGEHLLSLDGNVYVLPGKKRTTFSIKWLIISVSLTIVVIVGALVIALCFIRQHILAEAEKEELSESLLQDDEYILNREFIPDDVGPYPQGTMIDTGGTPGSLQSSYGPSESDPVLDSAAGKTTT